MLTVALSVSEWLVLLCSYYEDAAEKLPITRAYLPSDAQTEISIAQRTGALAWDASINISNAIYARPLLTS